MRIVVTGVKASGKSTVGAEMALRLGAPFTDLDNVVLQLYNRDGYTAESCAEIFRSVGESGFRKLEHTAIEQITRGEYGVLATGGSTLLDKEARRIARKSALWVYLDAPASMLWQRLTGKPLPSFLELSKKPKIDFYERHALVRETLRPLCEISINVESGSPEVIAEDISTLLKKRYPV